MKKVIKKAARVKNAPLVALAIFAAVFIGQKTFASFEVLTEEHWLYEPDAINPDPTDPSQYVSMDDITLECPGSRKDVCGIIAPNVNDQPDIDSTLEAEIGLGQKTTRVFLRQ